MMGRGSYGAYATDGGKGGGTVSSANDSQRRIAAIVLVLFYNGFSGGL